MNSDPIQKQNPDQHIDTEAGQLANGPKVAGERVIISQEETKKKEEDNEPIPVYFAMPARSAIGTFFGYCIGEFIKKFSKKISYYAGGGMLFLALLSYHNWITINWKQIDKDLLSLLFRGSKQASGFINYITRTLTHVIPLSAGMYVGLRYSLKGSFLPSNF